MGWCLSHIVNSLAYKWNRYVLAMGCIIWLEVSPLRSSFSSGDGAMWPSFCSRCCLACAKTMWQDWLAMGWWGQSCLVTPCYVSAFLNSRHWSSNLMSSSTVGVVNKEIKLCLQRWDTKDKLIEGWTAPGQAETMTTRCTSTCNSLINSCKVIVYMWASSCFLGRGTQTHQRPQDGFLALVIWCWTGPSDFLDGFLMAMPVPWLVLGLGSALCPFHFK